MRYWKSAAAMSAVLVLMLGIFAPGPARAADDAHLIVAREQAALAKVKSFVATVAGDTPVTQVLIVNPERTSLHFGGEHPTNIVYAAGTEYSRTAGGPWHSVIAAPPPSLLQILASPRAIDTGTVTVLPDEMQDGLTVGVTRYEQKKADGSTFVMTCSYDKATFLKHTCSLNQYGITSITVTHYDDPANIVDVPALVAPPDTPATSAAPAGLLEKQRAAFAAVSSFTMQSVNAPVKITATVIVHHAIGVAFVNGPMLVEQRNIDGVSYLHALNGAWAAHREEPKAISQTLFHAVPAPDSFTIGVLPDIQEIGITYGAEVLHVIADAAGQQARDTTCTYDKTTLLLHRCQLTLAGGQAIMMNFENYNDPHNAVAAPDGVTVPAASGP